MTEREVQAAMVRWFELRGYSLAEKARVEGGNRIDIRATSGADGEWRVEVKGDYDRRSAQYTVNFDTAMGQLLKSITRIDPLVKYGVAIPFSRTESRGTLTYCRILA